MAIKLTTVRLSAPLSSSYSQPAHRPRTMYTFAVCLVLAAGAYAHNHGMNNYGHMNMGNMNQMGMQGWGMTGMNQNNPMGNQMNMLAQILGMGMNNNMGMNNMGMNNMGMNNMGGGRNMGMMNNMMGMLLQTLMQNMGNRGNQGHESESSESDEDSHRPDVSQDDMRRLEQMMRMEFAMEVAEFVMVYQEYQAKMKAFEGAVDGLCLGVEAGYEHAKRFNIPTNETFDAQVDRIGEEIEAIEDREEQINRLVDVLQNHEEVFGAGFFKVAAMVCKTGEEYLKAYQKMEKMEDEKECACDKK